MVKITSILLRGGFIMTDFRTNGYVLVKQFLDPQSVATISQYLENSLKRFPQNVRGDDGTTKIAWYKDPLMEIILKNSLSEVEVVTGAQLDQTYSFARVYQDGEELTPHVDRGACEISVTCNIATVGKPWPIYMKVPGKEPIAHYLEPGDACIYKGCEVLHWRNKPVDTNINVQLMLHYVDKNGPNAGEKFDKQNLRGSN
jgi:hypothetical protein